MNQWVCDTHEWLLYIAFFNRDVRRDVNLKCVLSYLAARSIRDRGPVQVTPGEIALATKSWTPKLVRSCIEKLIALGYLHKTPMPGDDRGDVYALDLERLEENVWSGAPAFVQKQ